MKKTTLPLVLVATAGLLLVDPPAHAQAPTSPPATAEEVLANRETASAIKEKVKTDRYGFFITERGVVLGIHGADGKILFNKANEFLIQRGIPGIDGGMDFEHVGWINDSAVRTTIREAKADFGKVFEITAKHPMVTAETRIECRPTELVFKCEFKPEKFPDDPQVGLLSSIDVNAANVDAGDVNELANPVEFFTMDGQPIKVGYSKELRPFNDRGPGVTATTAGLRFYPFSRPSGEEPKKVSFEYRISFPAN